MAVLREELGKYKAVILYSPLKNEADPRSLGLPLSTTQIETPQDRDADPFVFAHEIAQKFSGKTVAILIPGSAFDALGTRHGRGGGWYDKFLSAIPRAWLRIGVCPEECFSQTPLVRAPHDEPMDWLVIPGREPFQAES